MDVWTHFYGLRVYGHRSLEVLTPGDWLGEHNYQKTIKIAFYGEKIAFYGEKIAFYGAKVAFYGEKIGTA